VPYDAYAHGTLGAIININEKKEGKMRKVVFAAIALLLATSVAYPQQTGWSRTYGGDNTESAACVRETTDGGYVILGKTYSFGAGEDDIWLLKVNAEGDTVWTRTYGGEDYEYGACLQVTKDGGFVIVGSTGSFGAGGGDIWLLKTDQYGDTLWSKLYGGDLYEHGCYVSEIEDSGYLIVGGTSSFGAGIYDIWVIRTDAAGDTVWTRTHGGEEEDWCFSANKTSDGIYVILAQLYSFGYYFLVRVYTDGEIERLEEYPAWRARYVTGDYVLTGCDYKSGAEPPYLWISKSDWYGWEEWHTLYGGENWEEGYCIETTDDGCYIVTGEKDYIDDSGSDLWLLKINTWGDTLWTRTYSSRDINCGYFVQQTSDGGYIVLGETKFLDNGSYDFWLIKTDANGDTLALIEEPISENSVNWEVVTSIGPQIALRYADYPQGFHASIFDATGRKVDELHSTECSGMITWGERYGCYGSGVYFIRQVSGNSAISHKVVLLR
jgi:hypothetical protein